MTQQSDAEGIVCAACGEVSLPGDAFCESCGADLVTGAPPALTPPAPEAAPERPAAPAPRTCTTCGGEIADDGYCSRCGAPAVKERDHFAEQPVPWIAAVSDRGVKHSRNEDAAAVAGLPEAGSLAALVVCDGVSTSADSDVASLAAARAARDVLTRRPDPSPSIAGRIRAWTDRLSLAATAANDAVLAVIATEAGEVRGGHLVSPPSCTFVAAVVDGPVIVAGAVGDSRAYWLPDGGPAAQLSTDDSWATEAVAAGLSRETAEASPQAHAITRWLGPDTPDHEPRCTAATPDGPGWLLVCSDGLWNYCSGAPEVADLVHGLAGEGRDPLALADALVAWANGRGGHDNITVALARLEAGQPEPEGTT